MPGSLEWTAQAAEGLVPPDPFGQLPDEHRPRSRPLSVIFRVDATDSADARRQLEEVITTAHAILAGLKPADTGKAPTPLVAGLGPVRTAPIPRPWDGDMRGMGE